MYESKGVFSKETFFIPSVSSSAKVSPGKLMAFNSSNARIEPLGIRGKKVSKAIFVGS